MFLLKSAIFTQNRTMRYFFLIGIIFFYSSTLAQFGQFQSVEETESAIRINTSKGKIEFLAFPKETIQVKFSRNSAENKQISNAVIIQPLKNVLKVQETEHSLILLREEVPVALYQKHEESIRFPLPGEDLRFTSFTSDTHVGFRYVLNEDEEIYGGGERAISLNRRGYHLPLYNQPSYGYGMGATALNYSLPIVSSNRNYLLFFDNAQKGYFDIGKRNESLFEYGTIGGELNFYFIKGKSQTELSSRLTVLTGSQPIPPRWALGHLQSRFGYRSQQQAEKVVEKTIAADIPIDATILDLFWFGNGEPGDWQMGDLDWQTDRFPQPEKMISEFKNHGVETILITEPFITDQSFNYREAIEEGILAKDSTGNHYVLTEFYFGKGGLIDIFEPQAQNWIWKKYNKQIQMGVSGWWVDLAEPEHHPSDVIHRIGSADEVHNIYGHYWDEMLFDGYRKNYPNERVFNLNRSGYAGSGRYGVFPWTGDVGRNWSGLQAQLPLLISMSIHGIPYIHSDAGGFAGGEKDAELYTRWMQFASLTPIFRPHGAVPAPESEDPTIEPEPVFWDNQTQKIVKEWIEYRYQLMPYFYQLAYEQWQNGLPVLRPVMNGNSIEENQFLLGEDILVAPIIKANVTDRQLFLPEGRWLHKQSHQVFTGKQWITVSTSIEQIPVFYRVGAILPMKPVFQNTKNYPEDFIFHIIKGEQNSTLNLFNDDGKTPYSIGQQQFEIIQINLKNVDDKLIVQLTSRGDYKNKAQQRNVKFIISQIDEVKTVESGGNEIDFQYNALTKQLFFMLSYWQNNSRQIIIR